MRDEFRVAAASCAACVLLAGAAGALVSGTIAAHRAELRRLAAAAREAADTAARLESELSAERGDAATRLATLFALQERHERLGRAHVALEADFKAQRERADAAEARARRFESERAAGAAELAALRAAGQQREAAAAAIEAENRRLRGIATEDRREVRRAVVAAVHACLPDLLATLGDAGEGDVSKDRGASLSGNESRGSNNECTSHGSEATALIQGTCS